MMKKTIFAIFAVAAIVFGVWRLNSAKKENLPEKPVVKIGATLPLTGDLAPIGQALKEGLLMAQEEIPADSKYEYELVLEDDQYDNRKVATNANRLISFNKIDAFLTLFDNGTNIVSPIAEKARVPSIGCAWGTRPYTMYEYSFKNFPRSETQAKAVVDFMHDSGIKSFAIVMQDYASEDELLAAVNRSADSYGMKITSLTKILREQRDFRIDIEKIRQQNPDGILLLTLEPRLTILAKQLRSLGMNQILFNIDDFLGVQDKTILNGSKLVYGSIGTSEFAEKFAKRTDLPTGNCVPNLYDAFKLLVSIYESADHKLTGEELKDALYKVRDYPSALGGRISVDADGIIDSPLVRARIENGKVAAE